MSEGTPMWVRVLIVDARQEMAETLAQGLAEHGFDASTSVSPDDAKRRLGSERFEVVVIDVGIPSTDGFAVLEHARSLDGDRPSLVMTASAESGIECIRRGAYHYLVKPFRLEELVIFMRRALCERSLRQEAISLRRALRATAPDGRLIARSAAMRSILDAVDRTAPAGTPVLLRGEPGTGKSIVARTLHDRSHRAASPYVTVTCAALPEHCELLGTSGSTTDRDLLAEAQAGTLLFDEIGDLALPLQHKLLRALERGVEARIVAATSHDLGARAMTGEFLTELLRRLGAVCIEVPPLRQRSEDIPPLAEAFLTSAGARHPGSTATRFEPDVYKQFLAYTWPGNVRELGHVVERLVVLASGESLTLQELPPSIRHAASADGTQFGAEVVSARELLRRYATWALDRCSGHRARTAEKLDIDPKTLNRWLAGSGTDSRSL